MKTLPTLIITAIIVLIALITPVSSDTNSETTTIVSVADNNLAPVATVVGNESGDTLEYYSYAVNNNSIMVHTTTKNVFGMELNTKSTIQQ